MKVMTTILLGLFAATAVADNSPAPTDLKSEQKIKHRRAAFTLMSSYFSRILNVVEGEVRYDRNGVLQDAKTVEMLSKLPWAGFVPGTEYGNTRAKPDIWLD